MDKKEDYEEKYEEGYEPSHSSIHQTTTLSANSLSHSRTFSETSAFSEQTDDTISDTSSQVCWPATGKSLHQISLSRSALRHNKIGIDERSDEVEPIDIELEMMKDRFSKLLLGEDMSGSGKGVCTAVTVSNAITNLYASIFGQHQRLEPLHPEKKMMWKREMNCLLSVCDYIVEFIPGSQNLLNTTIVEVMTNRQRLDLYINLPALRKLDALLLEILESFEETEFWYIEQGSMSGNSRTGSFRKTPQPQRKEEKWWLPMPCVPQGGLSENTRKHLRCKRDSTNQIHKAALAINSSILSDMDIPSTYMASLPKSGRASVGDTLYRYISAVKFSPDHILDCLGLSSEHEALELADRVEASMYTWRRKACLSHSISSWDLLKDLMVENDYQSDKNIVLAERAETLLFCLKQRYPELSQTTLDTSKIHYNRDVGKAILESYSRVLESLAFNIVARVEDVLFVDKSMRNQVDQ